MREKNLRITNIKNYLRRKAIKKMVNETNSRIEIIDNEDKLRRTQRCSLIHSKSEILKSLIRFPSEMSIIQSSLKIIERRNKNVY